MRITRMRITSPTTVKELILCLQDLPQEAVIYLKNDQTGEKFIINSLGVVHDELVITNIEENIDEGNDDELDEEEEEPG